MKTKIRDFYIGSEWLYYKIYIGNNSANIFLRRFGEEISLLMSNNAIESFFFIRYADPDCHLRIRFKVKCLEGISIVIKMMTQLIDPFFEEKIIYKVQVDTYNQEVERYGKDTIELSEKLFYADSKMILEYFGSKDRLEIIGSEIWFNALKIVDIYLEAFEFNLSKKASFMKELAIGFGREFPMSKTGKKQIALKYRSNRIKLDYTMKKESDESLKLFANELFDIAKEIMLKVDNNRIAVEYLLSSYLHMHCNRYFSNKQRMNEWLIYDFLAIYYKSELLKNKKDIEKEEAENLVE